MSAEYVSLPYDECQICFDTFPKMYKVKCGSTVDHRICFGCAEKWRARMPFRYGKRTMTCPTCRQEETDRPTCQEETDPIAPEGVIARMFWCIIRVYGGEPTPPRPRKVFCASGRDCRTRSRHHARTKTHLKCRTCQTVACCNSCRVCVTCEPL